MEAVRTWQRTLLQGRFHSCAPVPLTTPQSAKADDPVFMLIIFPSPHAAEPQQILSSPSSNPGYELQPGNASRRYPAQGNAPRQDSSSASRLLSALRLPQDVVDFIAIPRNDFKGCAEFLTKNQRFLSSVQPSLFEEAGAAAIRACDTELMYQCVQRLVIIQECRSKRLRTREQQYYLDDLAKEIPETTRHFYEDFNRIAYSIENEAGSPPATNTNNISARPTGSTGSSAQHPNSSLYSSGSAFASAQDSGGIYGVTQPISSGYGGNWPQQSSPFATYAGGQPSKFAPQPSYSTTNTSSTPYISSGTANPHALWARNPDREFAIPASPAYTTSTPGWNTTSNPGNFDRPAMDTSSGIMAEHNQAPSISLNEESDDNDSLPTVHGVENAEMKPNSLEMDPEPLDPNYRLQNGWPFFHQGRVFSIMFPELRGINPKDRGKRAKDPNVVIGPMGEEIYCHKKRFVVIRQRHGYSICVPINSYQRRGVTQQTEKGAHSIVYPSHQKRAPEPLRGETGMTKEAIAVDMHDKQTLDPTSRIHFGRPTSIDWNVKVMNVGRVAKSSIAYFEQYWKDEYFR
jgi:hypothetical protein